ncbi:ribonuclease P protein component [Spiroplasma clarkii]|uniref:Ribonuclease P protein component n=1 Tax=Spiroplasma clarkii TaxID=2139 RepID=A0A2K8KJV8_9MOLU|nr:ribonuclease P protein component [Spiroplasma clarkii]ATX71682.1 ribonuclease P (protein C5) [Spiroplasma clarkii]
MKNQYIIKKNHHFQNIISNKKYIKSPSFVIYYFIDDKKRFKYGVSVGKKLGNAVFRNKVKRQIRQMVRGLLPDIKEKKAQIIIMARVPITKMTFEQNLNELKNSLNKIR